MSNVRIHAPDGLHSWGLEWNYQLSDSHVPAMPFVLAVRNLPGYPQHSPGLWFHQCGSDHMCEGYQFFEYFGRDPQEVVLWAAQVVAKQLDCTVVM